MSLNRIGSRAIAFITFVVAAIAALAAAPPSREVADLAPGVELIRGGFEPGKQKSIEFLAQPGDPAEQAEVRADVATIDNGRALYPATQVLAAGDLVTLPAPFFDTACPAHSQAALERPEKVDFAVLVPGHGEPMSRTDFVTYRRAFDALLASAATPASNSKCVDGWQHDATTLLTTDRDNKLARALTDYYLTAILRGDEKKRAALCEAAE